MKGYYDNEGYYRKIIELQEKLRHSEEERMKLEEKFNKMLQNKREEEQLEVKLLKKQYCHFLEEEKLRNERNDQIIRALDRIEYKAAMLTAKTDRLRILRSQYETCVKRSLTWNKKAKPIENKPPDREISYNSQRPTTLNVGGNPFQSKFIYQNSTLGHSADVTNNAGPSTSYQTLVDNQYPLLTRNFDEQTKKHGSLYDMSYSNKQNITSFDNYNGSKIYSGFTTPSVQENTTIIRRTEPGSSLNPNFNRLQESHEWTNFNNAPAQTENGNSTSAATVNKGNDKTNGSSQYQEEPCHSASVHPGGGIWQAENGFNLRQQFDVSPNAAILEPLNKHQNNKQNPLIQFEAVGKSLEKAANGLALESSIPSTNSSIKPRKPEETVKEQSKAEEAENTEEGFQNASDAEILNNAYDGYYAEESQTMCEEPISGKDTKQEHNYGTIPRNIDNQLKGQIPSKGLHNINKLNGIEEKTYNLSPKAPADEVQQEEPESEASVPPLGEPTEVFGGDNAPETIEIETVDNTPIKGETPVDSCQEQSSAPKKVIKRSIDKNNIDPIVSTVSSSDGYDDSYKDPNQIQHKPMDEYENYDQPLGNSVTNYDQMQADFESRTNQLPEETGDYNQSEAINNENYEVGVNINQMPQVYENYEQQNGEQNNTSALQYEGYDTSGQPIDSNNYDEHVQPTGIYEQSEVEPNVQYSGENGLYDNNQLQMQPSEIYEEQNQSEADPNQKYSDDNAVYDENQLNMQHSDNYEEQNQSEVDSTALYAQDNQIYDENQMNMQPSDIYEEQSQPGVEPSLQYTEDNQVYDENQVNAQPSEIYEELSQPGVDPAQQYLEDNQVYDENQMNMQPSEIYNGQDQPGVDSTLQYTEDNQVYDDSQIQPTEIYQDQSQPGLEYSQDNQMYDENNGTYAENQEYLQDGSTYPEGTYQEGDINQENGVYQDNGDVYQENMYTTGEVVEGNQGQIDYSTASNQEIETTNYGSNVEMNLPSEPVVEKLASNISTILDSDTSEQQSSEQQQALSSTKDESDFDFSEPNQG